MSSINEFDENMKKLEEAISARRKAQCFQQQLYEENQNKNVCVQPQYIDAPNTMGYSCAKVSSSYYNNDTSNATINYLRVENQRLVNENQRLNNDIQKLIRERQILVNHINQLNDENNNLKVKKQKSKKITDFFVSVKEGAKLLYQDFIKWLNS